MIGEDGTDPAAVWNRRESTGKGNPSPSGIGRFVVQETSSTAPFTQRKPERQICLSLPGNDRCTIPLLNKDMTTNKKKWNWNGGNKIFSFPPSTAQCWNTWKKLLGERFYFKISINEESNICKSVLSDAFQSFTVLSKTLNYFKNEFTHLET